MKFFSDSPQTSRQGFTLVEVLVSSLLTLIVLGMLFAVLIGTINAWEGGTSKLEKSGDARLALDILKSDLEGLVARQTQYNQEWISSRPYTLPNTTITNTWLSFFSPSLDREAGQQGDIVAVSYAVGLMDPISTSNIVPIFALYKSMTSTSLAFNQAMGETLLTEKFGSDAFWPSGADGIPDLTFQNTSDVRKDLIMPHVVQFTVTWLVRDTTNVLKRINPSEFVRLNNTLEVGGTLGGKIEGAEISLTAITNEGMDRFRFFNDPARLPQIIKDFGSTHTIRVPITY